jgi:hypothetical protein
MDYTKGLPEKLEGFRAFLDQHPEWSEKVVLIQIAIPSREDVKEYQGLEGEVSKLVGQITGKYGKWLQKLIRLHAHFVQGRGRSTDFILTNNQLLPNRHHCSTSTAQFLLRSLLLCTRCLMSVSSLHAGTG